jgi:hypothetical protein
MLRWRRLSISSQSRHSLRNGSDGTLAIAFTIGTRTSVFDDPDAFTR